MKLSKQILHKQEIVQLGAVEWFLNYWNEQKKVFMLNNIPLSD